jgi:hypothetical protein
MCRIQRDKLGTLHELAWMASPPQQLQEISQHLCVIVEVPRLMASDSIADVVEVRLAFGPNLNYRTTGKGGAPNYTPLGRPLAIKAGTS